MAGLPQAQQVKRAQLKALHPEVVEAPQPEPVVLRSMDTPAELRAVEAPPVVSEEAPPGVVEATPTLEEQWRIANEQLQQRYSSLEGVIKNLEPELRSQKEARAKLERELQELRDAMPKPAPVFDPSEELTEEEIATYGASAPVIEKIAKKIAKGQMTSALADLRKEIAELRQQNTNIQTDLTQTSEQQFLAHVKSVVKGFDGITGSKEWSEYLAKKVPYSRNMIYDSLSAAHEARDLDTIKEIFEGFKPNKSALAAMTSPALNGGSAPINLNGNQKPILKWSQRKKISDDFRMGRIKRDEKDKWDKLYKDAEAEGRIDFEK